MAVDIERVPPPVLGLVKQWQREREPRRQFGRRPRGRPLVRPALQSE